ncbi:hypothetical protein [Edaphobacter aggregans]|uniref:hypothetical protein n=1 Tax=Edaphobacter aggregans TaxID=570835 RepID=UPI00054F4B15|nr:hypothetical protein [Edaphobacter aggregans]
MELIAPEELALISSADSADAHPLTIAQQDSKLPESPQKSPAVAPAFDYLRLMSSTSLEEGEEAFLNQPPRLVFNAETAIAMQNAMRTRLPASKSNSNDAAELALALDEPWRYERYHWSGLIAQSLFFSAIEASVRMASDDQIRRLVARKPFWHDYFASLRQFNMGRWNDGDNFLVNYVGHPMQGAVAAYIEIQNDPTGRQQQISATHDYWMSRFKGFLWSTAFSVQSELSPFGEAGIGNEGGWTYPINCHRPCARWNAKTMKSTNNTGWVDFIITPTVGMLWLMAEDTIDRYITGRIQGDRRSAAFPLILRGALNPSRTFANALRFKTPWYRDFQHGLPEKYDLAPQRRSGFGVHMLPGDDEIPAPLRRLSFAAHYRAMPLGSLNSPCGICIANHGAGFEVDYAITRWISASVSLDKQDGLMTPKKLAMSEASGAPDAMGKTVIAGFGVRLVRDRPHNTFSLAIRPGFVVDQVHIPAHVNTLKDSYQGPTAFSITHTAASLMLANDYKINRKFAVRSSFGATIVRYRTPVRDPDGIGTPPYISFLSKENFTNHTTWVWQGGPVFHF